MNETAEFVLRALLIGIGATVTLDLWSVFLQRCFGIPTLNLQMVGRWLGHLTRGRFGHANIASAAAVRGELAIGWIAHYVISVVFAGILLGVLGLHWARHPTLPPALVFGIVTVAAPFFVMQPGMGAGIAAAKTPKPSLARLRSVANHLMFGIGLYVAALLSNLLVRF